MGLDKNTVENLIILVASVLIFNGMINIPQIGAYFVKYPLLILGLAILLLILKDKIANIIGG